ncbi:MAG TPA: hypothetical protein PLO41_09865 [Rubrivivax sp.]|nr:hypothetical protein [Rubrivivax sp.]
MNKLDGHDIEDLVVGESAAEADIAYFVASRRRGVPTDAALSRCCAARRRCR